MLDIAPLAFVYNTTVGSTPTHPQAFTVAAIDQSSRSWTATTSAEWLQIDADSGTTAAQVDITVDIAELVVGVHTAAVTITDTADSTTTDITVRAVVNPATPVEITTWKNGHSGAFSLSTDDGYMSGVDELDEDGNFGTYVMNTLIAPTEYADAFATGHEIGCHLVHHLCDHTDGAGLHTEIVGNMPGAAAVCGWDRLISLIWPCGFYPIWYGVKAWDYFLSGRGYNINALEDPTPRDIMNIKSYNSHEHEPFPPGDLKSIVDGAVTQGKWANLVLHTMTNDDGAINYAATQDAWVAPIGTVVKYIMQRDRTIIGGWTPGTETATWTMRRLPMPVTRLRDFEASVFGEDTLTVRVPVSALGLSGAIDHVSAGTEVVSHDVRTEGGVDYLYFDTAVPTVERTIRVSTTAFAGGVPDPAEPSPAADGLAWTTIEMDYPNRTALLADGWSFDAIMPFGGTRSTESPSHITYTEDGVQIQTGAGDLWENINTSRNTLFRALPDNWRIVESTVDFSPTAHPEQAGMGLYANDNNYVVLLKVYHQSLEHPGRPALPGGWTETYMATVDELGGSPTLTSVPISPGRIRVRFVRDGDVAHLWYATDNTGWLPTGIDARVPVASVLMLFSGGDTGGTVPVTYSNVRIAVPSSIRLGLTPIGGMMLGTTPVIGAAVGDILIDIP